MNHDRIRFNGELTDVKIAPRNLVRFHNPRPSTYEDPNDMITDPQLFVRRLANAYNIQPKIYERPESLRFLGPEDHRVYVLFAELRLGAAGDGPTIHEAWRRVACELCNGYCNLILKNRPENDGLIMSFFN